MESTIDDYFTISDNAGILEEKRLTGYNRDDIMFFVDGSLAQLVEHLTLNQGVQGSSPWRRTQRYRFYGRMSHRVGAFLLYHEALLHDQHSSFAECINAFFSLALIISYAYAYDRPAADTYAHSRVI